MNKTRSTQNRHGPASRYAVFLSFLMLLLYVTAPNIPRPSVVFPFLLGLISLYYFFTVEKGLRATLKGMEINWFLAALLGFCSYLYINSLWSLATPAALGKSTFVLFLVLATLLASRAFLRQPPETLQRAAWYAVIGAVIGTLIICFEFSTDHFLQRMLYTYVPVTRASDKTITVLARINGELTQLPEAQFRNFYDDVVIRISSAALNRNLSLLLLLLWPALFLAVNHFKPSFGKIAGGLIAVSAAISIFAGHSQTAQIALLLSTVVFFATFYLPVFTYRCILSAWCVAVVLTLPLASAPYQAGLHTAQWIPSSFRDRMVIWDSTVEQAKKTPFLGIGIRSARVRSKELKKTQTEKTGDLLSRRLGLHSHNQFLQAWFELGAVGAAFLLALGIGLLQAIRKFQEDLRPYAYATFVAACVIASFGWGLWQTWLISGYALAVIMVTFSKALADKTRIRT